MGQIELDDYCKNIDYIQSEYHKISLIVRRLDKIIQSKKFRDAWREANNSRRWMLLLHLDQAEIKKVEEWISDYGCN